MYKWQGTELLLLFFIGICCAVFRLYSSLEKKLEDFDIERRNEVMTALQTAHDVKAAHIDRIHQLEMQLSRRNSIVERLTKVSKKVGMGIEELVDKLTKEL